MKGLNLEAKVFGSSKVSVQQNISLIWEKEISYKRRVITELEDENGKRLYEEQILLEIEAYYKNLYSSKIDATPASFSHFNENLETSRLTNEESANLEGLLTYEECKGTLKTFQYGTSPGEDGFTAEFYLEFFDLLGEGLIESFNAASRTGRLSISQRRRFINLIPKVDAHY